jgi:uncharacterized repeat protein (TIGR01451 family)
MHRPPAFCCLLIASLTTISTARSQDSVHDLPAVPAYDDKAGEKLPPARESSPAIPFELPPARVDDSILRTAGQTNAGLPPFADRLYEGPQEVGVLVDVTGPPAVNLNIDTKLTLTVRNQGRNDAHEVVITDALPPNLKFVEAAPRPDSSEGGVLVWRIGSLPAATERTIELKVTPVKEGPIDHVPRVDFSTGAKARMTILRPLLHVEVTPSKPQLLKGEVVDFNITVQNTGDGPANNVAVQTEISKGLRYEGEKLIWSQSIGNLGPKETYGPIPFTVDAIALGEQTCTVTVVSPDVVMPKDDPASKNLPASEAAAKVIVIAPELVVDVTGPTDWLKGSRAIYKVTVKNSGTAPAQEVVVAAFVPFNGVPEPPPETNVIEDRERSVYKIYWELPRLEAGQTRTFELPVRLDEIQTFGLSVAASAQGARAGERVDPVRDSIATKVEGIADVEILEIDRADQVIGVGDMTELTIRLRNEGSQEAKDVRVGLILSDHLKVEQTDGTEEVARADPAHPGRIMFPPIDRIPQGGEKKLYVQVSGVKSGLGDFRVVVASDTQTEDEAKEKKTTIRVHEGASAGS